MAREENPPFARGSTIYDGGTIDTNDLMGVDIVGKEWLFEDRSPDSPTNRTNHYVRCRAVRNDATFALLPKRLAIFSEDAGEYGSLVDGMVAIDVTTHDGTAATEVPAFPIDEYLPAAGCVANDVCWIVMEGPAVCLTGIANMATAITVGDRISALTAVTSGATTAGRVHLEATLAAATSGVNPATPAISPQVTEPETSIPR